MVPTLESLGIDRLTVFERVALAKAILESISSDPPPPQLDDSQKQELLRRVAHLKANPDDVVPWEEVRDAAHKRWSS